MLLSREMYQSMGHSLWYTSKRSMMFDYLVETTAVGKMRMNQKRGFSRMNKATLLRALEPSHGKTSAGYATRLMRFVEKAGEWESSQLAISRGLSREECNEYI